MSFTDVLERHSRVSYFSTEMPTCTVTENADGTAQVKGLTIFKSGTFRDSMGDQQTWTPEALSMMQFNYDLLKNSDAFPNVPVRADHSMSVTKIAGYVDAIKADSSYVYADFTFTEPSHYEAWKRGTYRSRSAEIGMYETNDGATYYPVIWGFAFVDIPAAEGLHSAARPNAQKYVCFDKEIPHVTTPTTFRVNGAETTDVGAVQVHIDALEKQVTTPAPVAFRVAGVDVTDATAVQTHITDVERQLADHAAQRPVTFRVGGVEASDPKAIQDHIDGLEKFRGDTKTATRKGFVDGLIAMGKIAQPAKLADGTDDNSMYDFVASLSDEQYTAYSATWDKAPKLSLFSEHGAPSGAGSGSQTPDRQSIAEQIEICEAVAADHRRSGMSQEQIEKTSNHQKLVALKAQNK